MDISKADIPNDVKTAAAAALRKFLVLTFLRCEAARSVQAAELRKLAAKAGAA